MKTPMFADRDFKSIFGVKKEAIHSAVIIVPFLSGSARAYTADATPRKGLLYTTFDCDGFTLVRSGIGQGLVGDAVLGLASTACKEIFLFGSCGAVAQTPETNIGSVVAIKRAYACESFTAMLREKRLGRAYDADKALYRRFAAKNDSFKAACGASVASLALEGHYRALFVRRAIDVLDMETAAFYAAARHGALAALSIAYISDILIKRPFYRPYSARAQASVDAAARRTFDSLCDFIKTSHT